MPFYPFLGQGSPTEIDYREKGTLILASLLEDLVYISIHGAAHLVAQVGQPRCPLLLVEVQEAVCVCVCVCVSSATWNAL